MIINSDNMLESEVNSYLHKVRAIVFDDNENLFLASMGGTYTLPGGGVEEKESIEDAMIRELHEELGIKVLPEELAYLGNYKFYHKNFPDYLGRKNRLNEIDLFLVLTEKEYQKDNTSFTTLENKENLKIIAIDIDKIEKLLNVSNSNPYKKALDEELNIFIKIIKERIKNVRNKI